jgi:hypothetical protein
MEILSVHVFKWKNKTCETIPGMGQGVKETDGRSELNYDILQEIL